MPAPAPNRLHVEQSSSERPSRRLDPLALCATRLAEPGWSSVILTRRVQGAGDSTEVPVGLNGRRLAGSPARLGRQGVWSVKPPTGGICRHVFDGWRDGGEQRWVERWTAGLENPSGLLSQGSNPQHHGFSNETMQLIRPLQVNARGRRRQVTVQRRLLER